VVMAEGQEGRPAVSTWVYLSSGLWNEVTICRPSMTELSSSYSFYGPYCPICISRYNLCEVVLLTL
jgi:hypothetical protein